MHTQHFIISTFFYTIPGIIYVSRSRVFFSLIPENHRIRAILFKQVFYGNIHSADCSSESAIGLGPGDFLQSFLPSHTSCPLQRALCPKLFLAI